MPLDIAVTIQRESQSKHLSLYLLTQISMAVRSSSVSSWFLRAGAELGEIGLPHRLLKRGKLERDCFHAPRS